MIMKQADETHPTKSQDWRNLRDEQGRLYGRVDRVRLLLEVRNHGKTIVFDLTRGIEIRAVETKVAK
jgi:hypothetical protein